MDDGLTRGVILFNRGDKCITRMIVCLNSLRKHFDGPVTLFLEGPHSQKLIEDLKKEFKVDIVYRDNSPSKYKALLRKIELCQESPYDLSMVLDTDTVVTGDFSEMFDAAKDHDLAICHFAGWSTKGGTIERRIRGYTPLKPDYVEAAVEHGPAINCGVFSWRKGTPIFKEWLEIAEWGEHKMYIADEVACQLLLPRYDTNVIGTRCNVSVLHDPGTPDPRIIHFHGKKHVIDSQKCSIWINEFIEALEKDLCGIRNIASSCRDDRRLYRFIHGHKATMHAELQKKVKNILGVVPVSTYPGFNDDDVTIVTACDKKYVNHLRTTLPNWIKHKHIDRFPVIVYVNGFRRAHRNSELDFIRQLLPNVQIIPWDMETAEDQRERMLTAFVLGAARDVKTLYWVKIDADAYATDDSPLLVPEMKDHVICGHRWGYSFAKHMGPLIDWANAHPVFNNTPKDQFDPSKVDGRKYWHPRVASFVQFHKSDFVRMAADMAGNRLPVPSHDTYLWYVANRLGLPIMRTNFKTHRGMDNKSDLESLKARVIGVDGNNEHANDAAQEDDKDAYDSQD